MHQLLGEYECKVDTKGRLRLPTDLLGQLPEGERTKFILIRGFEKYLKLYTTTAWQKIMADMDSLSDYKKEEGDFVRYFARGAQPVELDSADRMLLGRRLKEYAGIESDVVINAFGSRIEIWSAEQYDQMLNNEPENFSEMAERVMGGGARAPKGDA